MTVGLWIDFISGLFFLPLGIYVASKQPRTRAGLWFGLFAVSLGLRAIIDNAVRLLGFGEQVKFWTLAITAIIMVPALVATVRSMTWPHPADRWAFLGMALVAIGSYFVTWKSGAAPLHATAAGSAAALSVALPWVVARMAGDERDAWIATAFVPYATAYALAGISARFVDAANGTTWELWRWAANWGAPALAISAALAILLYHRRRRSAALLVTVALAALALTVWIGPSANDAGLNGTARIFAVVALGFAIVRHRAFGIDVKLRLTIRYSTAVAAIGVLFLTLTEAVEQLFQWDNPVIGMSSAIVLALLFRPMQSWAERFAAKVLPDATPIHERDEATRSGMYQRLSEAAWSDGKITRKEERMLEEARSQLGLTVQTTQLIDERVRATSPGTSIMMPGPEAA